MKKNNKHKHNNQHEHDLEHEAWSRRSFLQTLGLGTAGSIFLGGNYISAATFKPLIATLNQADNDRALVLIRLAGGNDGLNTVVPMNYFDIYAQNRPTIYHRENTLISLSDEYAIPNFMESLESMWGDGKMKIVHGIGYEDQSSSHFAGNDIMATANVDRIDDLDAKGWFGSYFNNKYNDFLTNPPEKPLAIQIGSSSNLVFNYDELQYAYLVANPDQLETIAQTGLQFSTDNINTQCKSGEQLQYLRNSANNTYQYAGAIHDSYINSTNAVEYEDNGLATQLALVARMIKGNLGTKVYMVTLSGFDTHANQLATQQELLTNVSNAVDAFYKDLEATGHDQNVLSMTFSEFGRRVYENGSNGTDHGKAAPALLFGPALNGNGFLGEHPDLNNITTRGDIEYTTDFRKLYSTVLSEWLCADESDIETSLNGAFDKLDLGFNCNGSTANTGDDPLSSSISSFSYFENDETIIKINANSTENIELKIYNILGQEMEGLNTSNMEISREKTINVNQSYVGLSSGYYVYMISNDNFKQTKKIMIK